MPRKRITKKDRKMSKYAHGKILNLLGEKGLNQNELTSITGVNEYDVSKCMNNEEEYKGRDFTIAEYADIAQYFGISLNDLFGIPNPVETSVPETARDACRMLVDIAKSNYRFTFKRDEDGNIYMYYPEIYPESAMKRIDPAAITPQYNARHSIHEFLRCWDELIHNFFKRIAGGEVTGEEKAQYNQILEDYLREVPDDGLEEDDHQKFIEWMSQAAEHSGE